jgi:hypothetical protein
VTPLIASQVPDTGVLALLVIVLISMVSRAVFHTVAFAQDTRRRRDDRGVADAFEHYGLYRAVSPPSHRY